MNVIYFQPPGIKPSVCEAGMISETDPEYIWYLDEPFNENCSLDGEFTVGEQIEIMQFIGLKDKYGNEIYEGDILEFPFEMGIAFVISDGFRFAIESPGSGAVDYEDGNVIKTTTIIGNIYENPDFLQGIILADT